MSDLDDDLAAEQRAINVRLRSVRERLCELAEEQMRGGPLTIHDVETAAVVCADLERAEAAIRLRAQDRRRPWRCGAAMRLERTA